MAERKGIRSRDVRCPRRSRLRLMIAGIMAGVTLTVGTGCSTLTGLKKVVTHRDFMDDILVGHRNRAWALRAWHREKVNHGHRRHISEFRQGFLDGYANVADGGDGCTPAIAPSDYWGWKYQSAEGQEKVRAWFAGYPLGAAAAEQDGLGNWSQIPTNFPQQVKMPPYDGGGTLPGPGGPVPIVPIGSDLVPTAADARQPGNVGDYPLSNGLEWSAVEMVPEGLPAAETP